MNEKELLNHVIHERFIEKFHEECDLKYRFAVYLRDKSFLDFNNKVPFPNARKLVYGCYDLWVDEDFVVSDKPERVSMHTMGKDSNGEEVLKKVNVGNSLKDGNYYEYETTFDKDFTTCELIIKTDFVLSRSGDKQHWCFTGWDLDEDGETIQIRTDSRLSE